MENVFVDMDQRASHVGQKGLPKYRKDPSGPEDDLDPGHRVVQQVSGRQGPRSRSLVYTR